jgi:hypothetical protein
VLIACVAGALAPSSASAVVNVTPGFTGDVVAGDGNCGLREAVQADNLNTIPAMPGECDGTGPDGISLPPGNFMLTIPGDDDLASALGDLDLVGATSIAGAGPGLTTITQTVTGQRVVHLLLNPSSGTSLTNLTVTGGTLSSATDELYGAGVFVDGDASTSGLPDLKNVRVVGNDITATGTAVARGAGVGANVPAASTPLRLEDVTVEDNDTTGITRGAGVSATDDLELTRTRIIFNDAAGNDVQGGGAWGGGVTMTRSVIQSNTASAPGATSNTEGGLGAGVYAEGLGPFNDSTFASNDVSTSASGRALGGGVFLTTAATEAITNVTFTNNTQTGGAVNFQGGGGIATGGGGTLRLSFVTLIDNTASAGAAIARLPGENVEFRASAIDAPLTGIACGAPTLGMAPSGTYISLGDNAGVGTSCELTGSGDLQGLAGGGLGLASLADGTGGAAAYQAGAPGTKDEVMTRRPPATSPVVDRVGPCTDAAGGTISLDARGLGRAQGPACDSGAMEVEYRNLTVSVLGNGTVTGTGINCPGDCNHSAIDGSVLNLSATPASGSIFGGWGGDCSGAGACDVTLSGNRFVSAQFNPASAAQPPSTPGPGFDLGAAIKKCKKKFPGKAKAKARKRCIKKAKARAKA